MSPHKSTIDERKRENEFQASLIRLLRESIRNCIVLKNDPSYIQGFPDLTVFLPNGRWAVLECKASMESPYQPNQEYYLDHLNRLGFARMICPENMEDVLHDLYETLLS